MPGSCEAPFEIWAKVSARTPVEESLEPAIPDKAYARFAFAPHGGTTTLGVRIEGRNGTAATFARYKREPEGRWRASSPTRLRSKNGQGFVTTVVGRDETWIVGDADEGAPALITSTPQGVRTRVMRMPPTGTVMTVAAASQGNCVTLIYETLSGTIEGNSKWALWSARVDAP